MKGIKKKKRILDNKKLTFKRFYSNLENLSGLNNEKKKFKVLKKKNYDKY